MIKHEIQFPHICKEGSFADELVEQQRQIRKAARELYRALALACPRAGDYQTNEARQRAYDEHRDRLIAAAKIKQDADRIILSIHRQTGYKWWVDASEETS